MALTCAGQRFETLVAGLALLTSYAYYLFCIYSIIYAYVDRKNNKTEVNRHVSLLTRYHRVQHIFHELVEV
jgi:hypothetical protein